MNRSRMLGFAATLISAAAHLKASANGFRLPDQDAFATARGEAFVATADNASAVYYNPAGLTQIEGSEFRGGIYGVYFDPTFTAPSTAPNHGQTYHIENNFAAAPQFFWARTLADLPLSFGLGVYAPFGAGVTWPQNTGFRAVGTESSLTYLRINPAIAIKLAPQLSIGGGINVNYAKIDLEQGLRPFAQPLTNYFRFKGEGWSVGYNLGVLWQPDDKVSIGATFRSATTVTMDGHTEFEQWPLIAPTRLGAQADFTFPLTAAFGISYRPTPKWNCEFDADYTDWSCLGTVTIHQKSTPPFGVKQDVPVVLNWRPAWMYEAGVTRYLDHGWHVSAGYIYAENAVPDTYFTPLVPDQDRHFFSLGAGVSGKRIDIDVAYQLGYGPSRMVSGSTPPSVPGQFAGQNGDGKYEFISHALFLTAGIRF